MSTTIYKNMNVPRGQYQFDYLPTGWTLLRAAAAQRTPNLFLCGGFGSSKTRTIGEIGLEFGATYDDIEIGFFRKTRTSIKATTYHDFTSDIIPSQYIADRDKSELKIRMAKTKAQFSFFGIDNYEKKGSLRFDIIFVDEATELTMDDIVMLQGRLRGKVLRLPLMIFVSNAGAPGTPLHLMFVQNDKRPKLSKEEVEVFTTYTDTGKKLHKDTQQFMDIERRVVAKENSDPDFLYLSVNSYENFHNPPAYFERLNKWKGTPYYNRFVLAEWEAFEGLVYGSVWKPDEHMIDPFEIPFDWPKTIVVDFGFTLQHPLVFLWITKNPITEIKYVYRQWYMTGILQRHADTECKLITEGANEKIDLIVGDHDAEGRAQVEHDFKMPFTPAIKDIKVGIQSVIEKLMTRPTDNMRGIYIFNDKWQNRQGFQYGLVRKDILLEENNLPTCVQEEFPRYAWGLDDLPKTVYNHALSCIRYEEQTDRWSEENISTVKPVGLSRGIRSPR